MATAPDPPPLAGGDGGPPRRDGGDDATTAEPAAADAAANAKAAQKPRPPPALPWMRVPVPIGGGDIPLDTVRGLDGRVDAWLRKCGFTTLFPVQAATWAASAGGRGGAHDLAVCAPTGSGKTLAYCLPLVHSLLADGDGGRGGRGGGAARARPPRLGGLVVVPTRDLGAQVGRVLEGLCAAVARPRLTVSLVTGARPAAAEAAALAGPAGACPPPGGLDYCGAASSSAAGAAAAAAAPADVAVATPGRLAGHLAALGPARAAAALAGLRFLVVDEADRLLRQDFSGWAAALAAALPPAGPGGAAGGGARTVRLAASATLTRDPARLATLGLWRPRYVALPPPPPPPPAAGAGAGAQPSPASRYALPPGLVDWRVDVPGGAAADKPAALVALLRQVGAGGGGGQAARALRRPGARLGPALIFAGSVATASAVAAFLSALDPPLAAPAGGGGGRAAAPPVALLARGVPPPARAAALADFAAGRLAALVASDGAARGLDVRPADGSATVVISYDAPAHAKALVHRAGRAARAGAPGAAFTLLARRDAAAYKRLRRKVGRQPADRVWALTPKGAGWEEAKAAAGAALAACGVGM